MEHNEMNKLKKYFLTTVLGLFAFAGISIAEETSVDKQDILAACTEESRGAIDVQEYIDTCVKEKEEEIKEMTKEESGSKQKS